MNPFPFLAALVATSLGVSPLQADDEPAGLPLSIFCFEYAPNLRAVLAEDGADSFVRIELSTANIVDAGMVLPEDGTLELYGPEEQGQAPHLVARAETKGIEAPVLMLAPAGPEDPLPYRCHVIDGGTGTFPMGSFRFVNFSPHPVRVTIGDRSVAVAPGGCEPIIPSTSPGEIESVAIEYKPDEHWLAVSNSRWAHRDDRRSIVAVDLSPQTGRMTVKSIPLRGNQENP